MSSEPVVAVLRRRYRPELLELKAAIRESRPARPAAEPAGLLALLDRYGVDGRGLTSTGRRKIWFWLYRSVVVPLKEGREPKGPRELLRALSLAGVSRKRVEAAAVHADDAVDSCLRAIRRGVVNPRGLLAFYEGQVQLDDLGAHAITADEQFAVWQPDLPAANQGEATEDCPPVDWSSVLDEPDMLTVDADDVMEHYLAAAGGAW